VHRAEHQVAGLGGLQGGGEGFRVTHFADQHHVGVLTHEELQCIGEVVHVDPDLPLVDQALVILEEIFDGVFDGDDVA
jgi:hypothetical protein